MTIERRNPLPPGRYWVDVFRFPGRDQIAQFDAWLKKGLAAKGPDGKASVQVVTAEMHDDTDPPWQWVLFQVNHPVKWEGPGLPTVAGDAVKTSDDTIQAPEIEQPDLNDLLGGLTGGGGGDDGGDGDKPSRALWFGLGAVGAAAGVAYLGYRVWKAQRELALAWRGF